jgi:hypothetical protein
MSGQPSPADGFVPAQGSHLTGAAVGMTVAGIAGVLIAGLLVSGAAAWSGVLAAMVIPAYLGIGALVFLAIHLAANATWITPYRSILAAMGTGTLAVAVGFIALAAGGGALVYAWWHAAGTDAHGALFRDPQGSKAAWMMPMRWIATGAIIIAVWAVVVAALRALNARSGDGHAALARWGVVALIVLIPTFTLVIWDALLALNVGFVSAMWGFYGLVGGIQAALAFLILIVLVVGRGPNARLGEKHLLHDLGTWMVGGACVVTYITFAQYAIISFANLDEETHFILMRQQHGYGWLYVAEAILRISPFAILMSQTARTHPVALIAAAVAVLAGFAIDITWIIVPAASPDHLPSVVWWVAHALAVLGGFGLWLLPVARLLAAAPVAPVGDTRLRPALDADHLH